MVTDGKSLNPLEDVVVDYHESEGLLDLSSFERIRAMQRPEFENADHLGAETGVEFGIDIPASLYSAIKPEVVVDLTEPKRQRLNLRDPVSDWARRVRRT